jgi:predicted alpha/beta-fold hydrolase
VDTEDGDVIGVYLTPGPQNAPLVFFVHGLEGSISAPMIRGVGTAMERLGWRVGALALRGCAIPNRKPRAYCAADSPDVQAALAFCCRVAQPRSVHTVGLSLGGNILAHWLIHHAAEGKSPGIPLRSAALIGSPHHLATSVVFTEEALYGFYQWNLIRTMRARLKRKAALYPDLQEHLELKKIRSLRAYDRHFSAPQLGYADEVDYYARTSTMGDLHRINVPTLHLFAADDPIVPMAAAPLSLAQHRNPLIQNILTQRGGHLGWVDMRGGRIHYWGEETVAAWLLEREKAE